MTYVIAKYLGSFMKNSRLWSKFATLDSTELTAT